MSQYELLNGDGIYDLLDNVTASIYWKDFDGHYLGCNQYMLERVLGISDRNQIIGKTDYELLSPEDAEKIVAIDKLVARDGIYEGEEVVTIGGETKIYLTTKKQLLNAKGDVVGVFGTSVDITHKKAAMELEKYQAILSEEIKMKQILDAVNASVYWKHNNEYYAGCNKFMLGLFGITSSDELIGKNEYNLASTDEAKVIHEIDQKVFEGSNYEGEDYITSADGIKRCFITTKVPLRDAADKIVGIIGTSIDITDKKRAEELRLENEVHKAAIEEQLKFAKVVRQLVHDIMSPLSGLSMLVQHLQDVPEDVRVVVAEATTRVRDITSHLLSLYSEKKPGNAIIDIDKPHAMLVSTAISEILAEKKFEYKRSPVVFKNNFTSDSYFAFISINVNLFKRLMSNAINNAAQATLNVKSAKVTVHLAVTADKVIITVEDSGCGMSPDLIDKIMLRTGTTSGKKDGNGVGMVQILDAVEKNNAKLKIESDPGIGSRLIFTFPRIPAPEWIATQIDLKVDHVLVVLDDDPSIHVAWDTYIKAAAPDMHINHFTHAAEAVEFMEMLGPKLQEKLFLLADYKLLKQDISGLDVIERVKPPTAILVTSHYAQSEIRQRAAKSGTKILPKQLAENVFIDLTGYPGRSEAEQIAHKKAMMIKKIAERKAKIEQDSAKFGVPVKAADLVLIDDDPMVTRSLLLFIYHGKKVDVFHTLDKFFLHLDLYAKDVIMLIDNNLGYNNPSSGIELARQLHDKGYERLYLFTGIDFVETTLPSYLTPIRKADLTSLGKLI